MRKLLNIVLIKGTIFGMIGILSLLIANNVLFLHTHKTSNGAIIIHAHPYQESDSHNSNHQHSKVELITFEHISQQFLIGFKELALPVITNAICIDVYYHVHFEHVNLPSTIGRDPPALFLF